MSVINKLKASLRKLHENGAFYIFIGDFINKFITMFGTIFVARFFSKNDFGLISNIDNIYGYIYLLSGLGMVNAIFRFVIITKEKEKQKAYYLYMRRVGFIFNVAVVVVILILSIFVQEIDNLVLLGTLIFPFHFIIDSSLYLFRAKIKNKRYALYNILISFLVILTRILAGYLNNVYLTFITKIIIYVLFAVILYFGANLTFDKDGETYKLLPEEKKKLFSYSLQFLVTNGVWALFMLNDIFLLNLLIKNNEIVADFKIAFTLPANLSLVTQSIGMFVAPYFIKNEKDSKWVLSNYLKLLLISFVLVSAFSLLFVLLSKQLVSLLFGAEYLNVVALMNVLIVGQLINSVFRYSPANLLSAMGKVKINTFVSLGGVILQIVLNVLLIPKYGVFGVAITSIIVFTLLSLILNGIFIYVYKVKKPKGT